MKSLSITLLVFLTAVSCTTQKKQRITADFETVQDSTSILFSVQGLSQPEAARYDESQNVYFISNFNGGGNDLDSNGFITKVDAEGNVVEMQFMNGTDEFPFHAPRGMYIEKESLWVADVTGVHVFDTKTGTHQKFIDFSSFQPGFLNDVSGDGSGSIYVTDTGKPIVYKYFLSHLPKHHSGNRAETMRNQ